MIRKVIDKGNMSIVDVNDVTVSKMYVYTKGFTVFKGNYIKLHQFGFVPLNGVSNKLPMFCSKSMKESIAMAINDGYNVYEIDNSYELIDFINNLIN